MVRLNAPQEAILTERFQIQRDVSARNQLIVANIGLVTLVAQQFRRHSHRFEDLIHEGVLGLIRAAETFDPNRQIRFSTYSVYWIRAKIWRFVRKNERIDELGSMNEEIDTPENWTLQQEMRKKVSHVLDGIVNELKDPRLKIIISLRLLAEEPLSLMAVGKKLNLSKEGTRLLEQKVLKLAKERLKY